MQHLNKILTILLIALLPTACAGNPSVGSPADSAVAAQVSETNQVDRSQEARRLNELGISAYKNKDYKDAINYYQRALVLNPVDYSIMNNLALALYRESNYLESISVSKEVVASTSNISEKSSALFNLGLAHQKLKNYDQALEFYRESCELNQSKSGCKLYEELSFNVSKKQQLDAVLGEKTINVSEPFKKYWDKYNCDELISPIRNGDLFFIKPTFSSNSIEDKPFRDLIRSAGHPIHKVKVNLGGVVDGTFVEQEAKSNFRIYKLNIDDSSDGSLEDIFFGDDWVGDSSYHVFKRSASKIHFVDSLIAARTFKDGVPLSSNMTEIARIRQKPYFISVEKNILRVLFLTELSTTKPNPICFAELI